MAQDDRRRIDERRFRDEAERGGRARGGGVEDRGPGAVGFRGADSFDDRSGDSGHDDRGGFVDDYRGGAGSGAPAPVHRGRGSGFGAFGSYDDQARLARRREDDESAGLHRGRGPKGYQRSDARILEDVNDRLTEDPRVDATEIEVRVENREVTLVGMVATRSEKRHAEDVAHGVSGVTHVQNNLRIQHASGGLDTVSATGAGGGTGGSFELAGGPGATGRIGPDPSPPAPQPKRTR